MGYRALPDRSVSSTPIYGPSHASSSSHPPSVRSQQARNDGPRIFRRYPLLPGEGFELGIDESYLSTYRALMLTAGQGGTFAYAGHFRNEHGKLVEYKPLKPGSTRIRHVRSFGNGIRFIGTKDCVTCVGVYFEIEGNRIFCAHINAWYSIDPRPRPGGLVEGSDEYHDIRAAVARRLEDHASEHGWTASSVDTDTLRLVGRYPGASGHAVPDGIMDFFHLAESPRVDDRFYGFLIAPGVRTKNDCMAGRFLRSRWEEHDDREIEVLEE